MELSLTLKVKWYNLIEQGIKKEEYRDIKPHWEKYIGNHMNEITKVLFTDYNRTMEFKVKNISIGRPKIEWTENPNRICYIIHLGERIK